MSGSVAVQVEIRTADDTGTTLRLCSQGASLVTDGHPVLTEWPSGDGFELNPFTGAISVGSYTVRVSDDVVAGSTRVVSQHLEDADGFGQLIGRRAIIRTNTNGAGWAAPRSGYITGVVQVSAIEWALTVSDSRRREARTKAFTRRPLGVFASGFFYEDFATYFARWPIRGTIVGSRLTSSWTAGQNVVSPVSPWSCSVLPASIGPNVWRLRPNAGRLAPNWATAVTVFTTLAAYANDRCRSLYGGPFAGFPSLIARCTVTSPNPSAPFFRELGSYLATDDVCPTVAGSEGFAFLAQFGGTDPFTGASNADISLLTSAPSEASPLYVQRHPVDLCTDLLTEAGVAFDTGGLAALRTAIGAKEARLRVTSADLSTEQALERFVFPWGISLRPHAGGGWELYRYRPVGAPTATITADHVTTDGVPSLWSQDEGSVVSDVLLRCEQYESTPLDVQTEDAPSDGVTVTAHTVARAVADQTAVGARTLTIDAVGAQFYDTAPFGDYAAQLGTEIATDVQARTRGGSRVATAEVLRGSAAFAAPVGSVVTVDLGHLPNGNMRRAEGGTTRRYQLVQRTEGVATASLRLVDAGPPV